MCACWNGLLIVLILLYMCTWNGLYCASPFCISDEVDATELISLAEELNREYKLVSVHFHI